MSDWKSGKFPLSGETWTEEDTEAIEEMFSKIRRLEGEVKIRNIAMAEAKKKIADLEARLEHERKTHDSELQAIASSHDKNLERLRECEKNNLVAAEYRVKQDARIAELEQYYVTADQVDIVDRLRKRIAVLEDELNARGSYE